LTKFEEYKTVKNLFGIFSKIFDLSKWFLTIGLTTLAFFLTVLLQIKLNSQIPSQKIALLVLLLISFSIALGIIVRAKFHIYFWASELKNITSALGSLITKASRELEMEDVGEEFESNMKEFSEFLKKFREKALGKSYSILIFFQIITFSIGITLLIIYFVRYLFFQ